MDGVPVSLHEVARFLAGFAPFDALGDDEVERLAASAKIEFARAGTEIFGQGLAHQDCSYVVRSGAIELVDGDHVIDTLGPGEVFGHPSMMTGLPTSAAARAVEDTLLYRLDGEVVRPLLARPEGLRFVARTLLARSAAGRPASGPVDLALTRIGDVVHAPALVVTPELTLREAAERMTAANQTAAVVALPDGWGILSDSDLRAKVVAGPLSSDDRVEAAMTAPAFTVGADRTGSDVMLEMLDRRLRHVPVTDAAGRVAGLVRAIDLLAAQGRAPFHVREAIARAATVEAVAAAAGDRARAAIAMRDAGMDAAHVGAILAVLDDAVVRRLVELGHERLGPPPVPVAWLVFGSTARRESVPSSDIDSGLVWIDVADDTDAPAWAGELARFVLDGLAASGVRIDEHGVRADDPLVSRSLSSWRKLADGLARDPRQQNAMALVRVLADVRAVTGPPDAAGLIGFVDTAVHHPDVLTLLRRIAVRDSRRAGARRTPRTVDLKDRGLRPIVDIARWAGIAAGVRANGTHARLRGASEAGVMDAGDARALVEAHVLLAELRLEHQAEQLRTGRAPDDVVDTGELDPLTRTYVREALREVAHVGRRLTHDAIWA